MRPSQRRLLEYLGVFVISVIVATLISYAVIPRSSTSSSSQQSTLDSVLKSGELRAAAPLAGGCPIACRDSAGNPMGWMIDMWTELAKSLKVKLVVIDTPGPSRIPFIQAGKVDVAQGTITLDRNQAIGFSLDPSDAGSQAGATLASTGITAYDQIGTRKVAVVSGSNAELFVPKLFPNASVQHFADSATALQALKAGQVAVDFDDLVTLAKAGQGDSTIKLLPAVQTQPGGLMARLWDQEWINYLTFFVRDFYSSGVTTCGCGIQIWAKWYGAPPAAPFIWHY